jgi:hypothetical protein
MQLPLFEEPAHYDDQALTCCLQSDAVALDIETETRWPGSGPRLDYGLSYPAEITCAGRKIHPFDNEGRYWSDEISNHDTCCTPPVSTRR